MLTQMLIRLFILLVFIIIVDIFSFYGFRRIFKHLKGNKVFRIFSFLHWLISFIFVAAFIIHLLATKAPGLDYIKFRTYFTYFGIFLLIYLPKFIFCDFLILEEIINLIIRIIKPKKPGYSVRNQKSGKTRIPSLIGLLLAIFMFFQIAYGLIWGKSNFKVREETIAFENLPESFDGIRILHFSDAHLGSFKNAKDVKKGVDLIKAQNVDLVLFTGDLVNNISDEVEAYISLFKEIESPLGKFSVLGNHDMSDYMKWDTITAKQENINQLIHFQEQMGFKVLNNENSILKNKTDSIAIIGVENWGLPPFKIYGDLNKALDGVGNVPFKILLSHDPSHWDAEITNETDIALTLSGHTHGAQLGISCCGIKWSPVKYIYTRWMGIYQENKQYLNVNAGFGYIGFPGRVGIYPEFSVITLKTI